MAPKTKTIVSGLLLLVIASTFLFISLNGKVALEVKCAGATYYVNESGNWLSVGVEKILMYQGGKSVTRSSCILRHETLASGFEAYTKRSIYNKTTYVYETWTFDPQSKQLSRFPVAHTIKVVNGSGRELRYVVSDLYYDSGSKKSIIPPQFFGHDMTVTWDTGQTVLDAYLTQNTGGKGTITIRYNVTSNDQTFDVRLFDPPSVEYSTTFCGTDGGWTGGQNITCLYNATTVDADFYSSWGRACTECNISLWLHTGNFSYGNAKVYYASANGSFANEIFFLESYNISHMCIKPEPGYDFQNCYIPVNQWVNIVVSMSDTSGLAQVWAYNSSGSLYNTFIYGSRLQKSYTTSGKFLAIDTGGWTDHFWLTNVTITDLLSTGGGAPPDEQNGSVNIAGGINFTLNTPLNGSNTTATSVNVSFRVWNMNVTASGGSPGWATVYDINMSTNPCTNGWTCGTGWAWDNASDKLFYNGTGNTGNLHSSNLGLSSYEAYNVSINISVQNLTLTKLHYMTDTGELDNCKFSVRYTNDTQHDIQRDCGSFSNTNAWNNGIEANVNIFVNVTANTTIACRTAAGTTSCTSSAGADLTDLGDYFGIDDPQTCIGCAANTPWMNITRFTVVAFTSGGVAGNTTLNASVYNGSGTLLYNVTGVANGSVVSFNWTGLQFGNNFWYATIRTQNNVLNVTNMRVNVTTSSAPAGNLTVTLVTPTASAGIVKNQFFNFTINITCSGGICGDVEAYLDPVSTCGNVICGNETYDGAGTLSGKTWAEIEWRLQSPYVNNPNGWVIYQTFSSAGKTLLWPPWYVYDNDMAEANLKDAYVGGTATFTKNTAVTDESSEWWVGSAGNVSFLTVQLFTNYLDACVDSQVSHNNGGISNMLVSWICSHDGSTITKNDQNSASDATSRLAMGYFICSKRMDFTSSQRQFCLDRAVNMSYQSIQQEWINNCQPSPINGTSNLCRWRVAGAAQAWGPGALTQVGEQMFIGYHEADIEHLLMACAITGDQTFCDYAEDETHQFLYVMGYDGVGNSSSDFTMAQCNRHYYMVCPGGGAPCTSTCSGSAGGFEDADATRAWETCKNVHNAELTYATRGQALPWEFVQLRNYCQAWATRVANSGSVSAGGTQLVDSDNGCVQIATGGTCKSTHGVARYREQGWVLNMVGFKGDPAYFESFIAGPLSRFNLTRQYYDKAGGETDYGAVGGNPTPSTIGYGTYGQIRLLRAIRQWSGYYDFLYQNQTFNYTGWVQGTGSGGGFNFTEPTTPPVTGTKNGTLVSTLIGDTPVYTIHANPNTTASCLSNMQNGSSCLITWTVNTTGTVGEVLEFWAYATGDGGMANSTRINLTIVSSDTTAPVMGTPTVTTTNSTASIAWTNNEATNLTIRYGTTPTSLSSSASNSTYSVTYNRTIGGLQAYTVYYYNRTVCDAQGNCASDTTARSFTTADSIRPTVVLSSPANNTNKTVSLLSFTWTATDNSATTMLCSLWTNSTGTWKANVTGINVTNGTLKSQDINGFVNGTYKWNVQCNDTFWNLNNFASANFTFRVAIATHVLPSVLCSAQNALTFNPSGAYRNLTTGNLTQYAIRAMNQSACACTYRVNNTLGVNVTTQFSWDITSPNYQARANNLTFPRNFTVTPAAVGCYNITLDYINASTAVGNFTITSVVT